MAKVIGRWSGQVDIDFEWDDEKDCFINSVMPHKKMTEYIVNGGVADNILFCIGREYAGFSTVSVTQTHADLYWPPTDEHTKEGQLEPQDKTS